MTSPSGPTIDNSLDDIFGSSPPHEPSRAPEHEPAPTNKSLSSVEPSELPFLRRQHVTAGYRDGISTSKGEHVQEGFDAGFPVGAQLGMRAGTVIGILEGVLRGYESRAASAVVKKLPGRTGAGATAAGSSRKKGEEGQGGKELDEEARRARREEVLKLYQSAVKALHVQGVFGTLEEGGEDGEGKPSPETQLAGKGDGVVSKWENRVHVAHWEENMDVLQMKEDHGESQAQAQGQDEGAEVAGSQS